MVRLYAAVRSRGRSSTLDRTISAYRHRQAMNMSPDCSGLTTVGSFPVSWYTPSSTKEARSVSTGVGIPRSATSDQRTMPGKRRFENGEQGGEECLKSRACQAVPGLCRLPGVPLVYLPVEVRAFCEVTATGQVGRSLVFLFTVHVSCPLSHLSHCVCFREKPYTLQNTKYRTAWHHPLATYPYNIRLALHREV